MKRELRVETGRSSYLWEPHYNIAPTDQVPIVVRRENGERSMLPMVWGISRNRNGRMMRQINAPAESVSARSARCAAITDGFYEWAGAKSAARQPYFFRRADDGLILLAGLWQGHRDGGGSVRAFTIVTTRANSMVMPIYDRMPAILEGDALALWLNAKTFAADLLGLLAPAADDLLEIGRVWPFVNSVKNEGPELVSPLTLRARRP